MPAPEAGIIALLEWLRANEHQSLDAIIAACLQRGYTKRVINAALQAYIVGKVHH